MTCCQNRFCTCSVHQRNQAHQRVDLRVELLVTRCLSTSYQMSVAASKKVVDSADISTTQERRGRGFLKKKKNPVESTFRENTENKHPPAVSIVQGVRNDQYGFRSDLLLTFELSLQTEIVSFMTRNTPRRPQDQIFRILLTRCGTKICYTVSQVQNNYKGLLDSNILPNRQMISEGCY